MPRDDHTRIPSFQEWKGLNDEQRDYYLYHALTMVTKFEEKHTKMDDKYAGKWVEKAAVWAIYSVAGLLLIAFMGLIIINAPAL